MGERTMLLRCLAVVSALAQPAVAQSLAVSSDQGCADMVTRFSPIATVPINPGLQTSIALMTLPKIASFLDSSVDIDHDGTPEIVLVGRGYQIGGTGELSHSSFALIQGLPEEGPKTAAAADRMANVLVRGDFPVDKIIFADIDGWLSFKGAEPLSLPDLGEADAVVGRLDGDVVVSVIASVESNASDEPLSKKVWSLLVRLKPHWTADVLCAGPVPE